VQMALIVSDTLTDLSRGWNSWLQFGGNMRIATPLSLHYSVACMDKCKSWLFSNRTIGISFKCLACGMKCFTHLKTDPPSSTQMVVPCVKSDECTQCSITVLVTSLLSQSVVPCCSILPEYEKESEKPSPRPLLTSRIFAQLSHLVALRHFVCCFCLNSSCK
jgi:hypothetical protein